MRTICKTLWSMRAVLGLGALLLTVRADASSGDSSSPSSQAKVLAHLHLSDGGARRMFLRQEGKTRYLYVQQPSGQGFTVIDVTKPGSPRLIKRLPLETLTVVGSGLVITGVPAKSATMSASAAADAIPEPVHVVDAGDPGNLRTLQTYDGPASILQDSARNLIYVLDNDGVWILSHHQHQRRHECSSSDAISPIPNCD
jgi:hypothetical protein